MKFKNNTNIIFALTAVIIFFITGCDYFGDREYSVNSDKTLGVFVAEDGLYIKKMHYDDYVHNTIHVENVQSDGNVYISTDEKTDSFFYPFVEAGQTYKVYVKLRDSSWSGIDTPSVYVTAAGGEGDFTVQCKYNSKSYNEETKTITFNEFKINNPGVEISSERYSGNFWYRGTWNGSTWNYINVEDSRINLNEYFDMEQLSQKGSNTFFVQFAYSFYYNNVKYEKEFISNSDCVFRYKEIIPEGTNLPEVRLSTLSGNEITSKDEWVDAQLIIDGESFSTKVKGRGNSSWGMPKKSYSLKLDDKSKILGMKKSKRWVLIANYADKSLLRNYFASYLGTKVFNSSWNPSFKNIDLFINDVYMGTYLLGEQIKIDSNRINVQDISELNGKKFADWEDVNKDGTIDINDGGFIVEVNQRLDELYNFTTTKNVPVSLKDPDEVSTEIQLHVKKIIQNTEDALFIVNQNDSIDEIEKVLDTDSFIDWYFVNEFSKNVDAATFSSIYMWYNPAEGKIYYGPDWDFDLGFGNLDYNELCQDSDGWYINDENQGNVWFKQCMKNKAFRQKVKNRFAAKKDELKNAVYSIQSMADSISASAEYNFRVWNILGSYVWPNPSGYEKRVEYQDEVDFLKDWCEKRYEWICGNIGGV